MKQPRRAIAALGEPRKTDSDDRFTFVAGYTEGGYPYGITWEELGADKSRESVPCRSPGEQDVW